MNKNIAIFILLAGFFFVSACGEKKEATPTTSEVKPNHQVDSLESSSNDGFKGWLTSETAAFDKAKGEDRSVLILFTGSDWCPPCMMMEKEVFSTTEFKQFAEKNIVLLLADFPRAKDQSAQQKEANDILGKKYDVEAFPTVILVNQDGKVLWKNLGHLPGGPNALIEQINKNNQ